MNNTGALLKATILSFGTSPIVDHGFEWRFSDDKVPGIDNISLGATTSRSFETLISRIFEPKTYYKVRAFVRTDKRTSYGEWVTFNGAGSLPPIVGEFFPKSGTWGDTITIKGSNFSFNYTFVSVEFGGVKGSVVVTTDTLIRVKVPNDFTGSPKTKLKVVVGPNTAITTSEFQLLETVINSITPGKGGSNSNIVIKGKYFSKSSLSVKIGELNIPIDVKYSDSIKFKLLPNVVPGENDVIVVSGPFTKVLTKAFTRTYPKILEIIPNNGYFGDVVTIRGEGFGSQFSDTQVSFNNGGNNFQNYQIQDLKVNELQIVIPVLPSTQIRIKIKADFAEYESDKMFTINPPKINSIQPTDGVYPGQPITINGSGFVNNYYDSYYYKDYAEVRVDNVPAMVKTYSATSLTFTMPFVSSNVSTITMTSQGIVRTTSTQNISTPFVKFSLAPSNFVIGSSCFVINNKCYTIQNNQVLSFDVTTKAWSNLKNFPGPGRTNSGSFSLGGKGYIFGGTTGIDLINDLWEYDPSADNWIQKNKPPYRFVEAFNLNGVVYSTLNGDGLFKYNQALDTWEQKSSQDFTFSMPIENELYVCKRINPYQYGFNCYRYDGMSDKWIFMNSVELAEYNDFSYAIAYNGVGLVGGTTKLYAYYASSNSWGVLANNLVPYMFGSFSTSKFRIDNKWYMIQRDGVVYQFNGAYSGL
ncbi:MAG: IPT/TIG domain-containing protein [Cytophagales bacterium]|nr:IPT/TIG domain-containing protein [Cytophagales bacterium]